MTLAEKLLKIRKSIKAIKKDGYNQHYKFKFISSENVLKTVREEMDKQGVLLVPSVSGIPDDPSIPILPMSYTWYNAEDMNDKLSVKWVAIANDKSNTAYAFGKALTYAEKYFMYKFFQIPSDELDPDRVGGGNSKKPATNPQPQPKKSQKTKADDITEKQRKMLFALMGQKQLSKESAKRFYDWMKGKDREKMSKGKAKVFIDKFDEWLEKFIDFESANREIPEESEPQLPDGSNYNGIEVE